MPETRTLSDNELKLRELCRLLERLKKDKETARTQAVLTAISIRNINKIILETEMDINELERKGVQHYPDTAESESVGRSPKEAA